MRSIRQQAIPPGRNTSARHRSPASWRSLRLCALALAALALPRPLHAQDLLSRQTPYSAWIDLRPATASTLPQTLPSWVESLEFLPAAAGDEGDTLSIRRIRVQRPPGATGDLQFRLFFDDEPGVSPQISGWNELGSELMRSGPLGTGLGLPTSTTLTIPMDQVNYLEVEAPGDGSRVRGAFLGWLEKKEVTAPIDFPAESPTEPFRILSATRRQQNDQFLYGVVTASLLSDPVKLGAPADDAGAEDAPPVTAALLEFNLEKVPLVALVTFEVLSAGTIQAPPDVAVNGRALGPASLHLPDLADPGYQGQTNSASSALDIPYAGWPSVRMVAPQTATGLDFRYTGWLKAQIVVPASALAAGMNSLIIQLSNSESNAAIRSVDIQLKYNWEKLDYVISPAAAQDH